MQKTELVTMLVTKTGLRHTQADAVIAAFIEQITNALSRGEPVSITGFGSFTVKMRAARNGRNPKTGEPLIISASRRIVFTPGKTLREALIIAGG